MAADVIGTVFPYIVIVPPLVAVAARVIGARSLRRTFHAQIAANRLNTVTMICASVSVVVLVWFLIAGFIGNSLSNGNSPRDAMTVGVIAGVVTLVAAVFGYLFGDRFVLAALHAREVDRDTSDIAERQLLDVVREMAIAADLPGPRSHVIDDDRPNALATGRDPAHASIVVTRGLLREMDREQLQSVVAHEFAHVRNHDARLSLVLAVLGGAMVLFFEAVLRFFRGGSISSGGGCAGALAGIILTAVALAVAWSLRAAAGAVARALQASVSREREFLADATAVEIGRNPRGLRRALESMIDPDASWRTQARDDEEGQKEPVPGTRPRTSATDSGFRHLFFVDPSTLLDDESIRIFATHPSIHERLARLADLLRPVDPMEDSGAPPSA